MLILEMLLDIDHAKILLNAALETGLPVWVGLSCCISKFDETVVGRNFRAEKEKSLIYDEKIYQEQPKFLPEDDIILFEDIIKKNYDKINIANSDKRIIVIFESTLNMYIKPYPKCFHNIIKNINLSMREDNAKTAAEFTEFLKDLSAQNNLKEIDDAISKLLENQIQKLMLSSADKNYVFKTIDSPIAPEIKSSPSLSQIYS